MSQIRQARLNQSCVLNLIISGEVDGVGGSSSHNTGDAQGVHGPPVLRRILTGLLAGRHVQFRQVLSAERTGCHPPYRHADLGPLPGIPFCPKYCRLFLACLTFAVRHLPPPFETDEVFCPGTVQYPISSIQEEAEFFMQIFRLWYGLSPLRFRHDEA
jgi:hypothetical protein